MFPLRNYKVVTQEITNKLFSVWQEIHAATSSIVSRAQNEKQFVLLMDKKVSHLDFRLRVEFESVLLPLYQQYALNLNAAFEVLVSEQLSNHEFAVFISKSKKPLKELLSLPMQRIEHYPILIKVSVFTFSSNLSDMEITSR